MQLLLIVLLTALALAAAAYAHYRTPYHTKSARDRWFVHVFLIALGLTFAWVTSHRIPAPGSLGVLVFLSAFGAVHIPAAAILFIKRQQKKTNDPTYKGY